MYAISTENKIDGATFLELSPDEIASITKTVGTRIKLQKLQKQVIKTI